MPSTADDPLPSSGQRKLFFYYFGDDPVLEPPETRPVKIPDFPIFNAGFDGTMRAVCARCRSDMGETLTALTRTFCQKCMAQIAKDRPEKEAEGAQTWTAEEIFAREG
jgi:hypothetical protein